MWNKLKQTFSHLYILLKKYESFCSLSLFGCADVSLEAEKFIFKGKKQPANVRASFQNNLFPQTTGDGVLNNLLPNKRHNLHNILIFYGSREASQSRARGHKLRWWKVKGTFCSESFCMSNLNVENWVRCFIWAQNKTHLCIKSKSNEWKKNCTHLTKKKKNS